MVKVIVQDLWDGLLEWGYSKAIKGSGGLEKASSLALKYSNPSLTVGQQVDMLIRRQQLLAGSSGFITGLGGVFSLPLAIPANLASVVYIQIRMITAIAYLGGYDIEDKEVKQMAFACMAANAALNILEKSSLKAGSKLLRFSKGIPLAGGIIGGSVDMLSTAIIGRIAKKTFLTVENN